MSRALRLFVAGCLTVAGLGVSACAATNAGAPVPTRVAPPTASVAPPDGALGWWHPEGAPQTIATGLNAPWSVVPLADGGALISQRDDGAVVELEPTGELRQAGVVSGVVSGGESGLHGLAVLVEGETTWVYAYHGAAEDNRVVRMPLRGDPGALALGAPQVILAGIPRASTHDGGRIAFGPDGMLYVATGDAQNPAAAQDPSSLGGKILRVNPDGSAADGNPWGNAVWSLGHRNVQGLAWTTDGTMWASEFGQNTWDELNRIEPGANYGWPVVEGVADRPELTDPVAVWSTAEASPSGIAAVGDTVFVAGLRGERLWVVDTAGEETAREPFAVLAGEQGRLRDVVEAVDGSLWILTANTDGRGAPRPDDDLLFRLPLGRAG